MAVAQQPFSLENMLSNMPGATQASMDKIKKAFTQAAARAQDPNRYQSTMPSYDAWSTYQHGGNERGQYTRAQYDKEKDFEVRYNTDPAFKAQVKKARKEKGGFLDRIGGAFQNIGDLAGDTVHDLGPFAALVGGGMALTGALGGAGATALNTGTAGATAGAGSIPGVGTALGPPSTLATSAGGPPSVLSSGAGGGGLASNALGSTAGNNLLGSSTLDNLLIGGSSLLSGALSADAVGDASDEIGRQFDLTRQDFAPYMAAGTNALGNLENFDISTIENDPMYQLARDEGLRAVNRGNSARGLNLSGNALIDEARTGAAIASGYGSDIWNRTKSIADMGLGGTGTVANLGGNAANNLANLQMQQGQGWNNAIQGGITNYLHNNNPYFNNPYLLG